MDDRRFKVRYRVSSDERGLTTQQLQASSEAGCDALLVVAINRSAGQPSFRILSVDGATEKPLRDSDLFAAWSALAQELAQHCPNLPRPALQVARAAYEGACAHFGGEQPRLAWFPTGTRCASCAYPVIVTSAQESGLCTWYCVNPRCAHHVPEDVDDVEPPAWVAFRSRSPQRLPWPVH